MDTATPDGSQSANKQAGSRHYTALTCGLVIAAVLAPLFGTAFPRRSPVAFALTLILLVLLLVTVVKRARHWLRSGDRGGRRGYVLAAVTAVGGVASFLMVSLMADDAGIAGSALPRVLNGIPFAIDFAYLAASTAAIGVVLAAVGLIVVLARRRVRAGLQDVGRSAASAVQAVAGKPERDRGLVPVTRVSDGFWRRLMSPSTWVVFALSVLIAVPAFRILAADPAGELGLIGFLFIFPGVPVTAWAALQTTWRPDERAGYMLATLLRGVLVPAVTVPPLTIVHVILTRIPVLHDRVLAHQRPDAYLRHYWFSGESGAINVIDGSLAETIFMSLLGGFAFSLIAALVISVFVVWPVNAVRNPTALFRDAMLSDDPAVAATNIVAVRALSGVMMLAFVVPTLMVLSDSDEPLWWVGAALIPVLVWLVYLVWKRQRVDHVRRAKYGMAAAVPNPADPPPDH
ncbi:hypothetical protein [Thermocrispum municipale]|uniref:hypothetical protein n=1 Tax=Thermocrispum municipale TaxID=37926 RepID=UPI0003F56708|nr:hypothetical protein [Thermocrispum municipale]